VTGDKLDSVISKILVPGHGDMLFANVDSRKRCLNVLYICLVAILMLPHWIKTLGNTGSFENNCKNNQWKFLIVSLNIIKGTVHFEPLNENGKKSPRHFQKCRQKDLMASLKVPAILIGGISRYAWKINCRHLLQSAINTLPRHK
jgi:hypothetical protein